MHHVVDGTRHDSLNTYQTQVSPPSSLRVFGARESLVYIFAFQIFVVLSRYDGQGDE
jgi:hypothetical protein